MENRERMFLSLSLQIPGVAKNAWTSSGYFYYLTYKTASSEVDTC